MNTFSGDHYQVWSHATVVSLSLVYQPLQVTPLEQAVLPTHPDSNDSQEGFNHQVHPNRTSHRKAPRDNNKTYNGPVVPPGEPTKSHF